MTQNTTKPVQVPQTQLRQTASRQLINYKQALLISKNAKLLDPCRTDPRRLEFYPAACHQCCKRELISWPTDKCRLSAAWLYGQVARKSSRPKSCRPKPESCRPKFIVMSPDILSHVARNFIMLKKILKLLVRVKRETMKLRLFVSLSFSWR